MTCDAPPSQSRVWLRVRRGACLCDDDGIEVVERFVISFHAAFPQLDGQFLPSFSAAAAKVVVVVIFWIDGRRFGQFDSLFQAVWPDVYAGQPGEM